MLLAVSLGMVWTGMAMTLHAYKGWSFTALMLGEWGKPQSTPAGSSVVTGPKNSLAPGGQYLVPTNPNQGATVPLPGSGPGYRGSSYSGPPAPAPPGGVV